ncbi:MAG: hypothetical protein R3C11_25245 [Planctomycetaceae bacterium]
MTADASTLNVPQTGTVAVQVKAERYNYAGPIEISAVDLPEGLTANRTVMGPGKNEVMLTLSGTAETARGNINTIKVIGMVKQGDQELIETATVTSAWKTELNNMTTLSDQYEDSLVLGVGPALPYRIRFETNEIVLGPKLSIGSKIIVERNEGFNEAITLAVNPPADKQGLPANITAAVSPVEQDKNEVGITFTATDKAALGEFTIALSATLTKEKQAYSQSLPGVTLKLLAPLTASTSLEKTEARRTETIPLKLTVNRNPALAGEITYKLNNLPEGYAATTGTLAADAAEGTIMLTDSRAAPLGEVTNLIFTLELKRGKEVFKVDTAPVSFKVIE